MSSTPNPFGSRGSITVDGQEAVIYRLPELEKQGLGRLDRLPFSIRILLENALRFAGHGIVTEQVVRDILNWKPVDASRSEIPLMPARVPNASRK